jgi:mannitol/fructose-specific phosphotransferase system IIA component (Ntr-type)
MGMALIPQAGVAVGLLLMVQDDPALAPIASQVLTVGLTVVALNEIVGPLLVRTALIRSGETGHDRPRLIDFLHEENIITNLKAETKEEAIEQLVDVLIRTNRLEADRERLLKTVLDREAEVSTCFGDGLAVPHGQLDAGNMVGAMGISREGLPFETPDGIPVHCMVVLATPPDQRDRHLQVMAALARAIGTDRAVQRQLFSADTAAHAYEILHIEDARDFNYFLDEDEGLEGEAASAT